MSLGELLLMLVIGETDLKSVMLLYTINQFLLLFPLKSVKTLKKFLLDFLCDHIKATEMLNLCSLDSRYFNKGVKPLPSYSRIPSAPATRQNHSSVGKTLQ